MPVAAPMPWKSTLVMTKPGDQEVDVGQRSRAADGAAEDVAEDEQEQDALRRPGHDQLRASARTS